MTGMWKCQTLAVLAMLVLAVLVTAAAVMVVVVVVAGATGHVPRRGVCGGRAVGASDWPVAFRSRPEAECFQRAVWPV